MIPAEKPAGPGQKNENEALHHDMQLLMKKFLYEVYKQLRHKGLSKSALASQVGVTPGYLSQVFHSKKPLTFQLLIKFQQVLNIEFEIKVKPV